MKKYFNFEYLKFALKQYKFLGISTCLFLIAVGILMFCFPLETNGIAIWILIIGLFFVGSFDLFAYFFGNKENKRNNIILIKALINIILSLVILVPLIIDTIEVGFLSAIKISTENILGWIFIMFGIIIAGSGLTQILRSNIVFKMGGSRISELINGTLQLILGILISFFPLYGLVILTYILGTFFIIYGIILFIELLTSPIIRDYSKPFIPKKAKKNSKNEEINAEIVDDNKLMK